MQVITNYYCFQIEMKYNMLASGNKELPDNKPVWLLVLVKLYD